MLPPVRKLFRCSKSSALPSACNSPRSEFRALAVTDFAQRNSNKRSAVESGGAWSVVKGFRCLWIEWNELIVAAAPDGLITVPIVGKEIFHRREQEGSEFAMESIRARVGFGSQKECEK